MLSFLDISRGCSRAASLEAQKVEMVEFKSDRGGMGDRCNGEGGNERQPKLALAFDALELNTVI
jgi:hypothetical protein